MVECFLKVYKAAADFRGTVTCLLNHGSEGKNVVDGLMSWSEPCLTVGFEISLLKIVGKLHVESGSVEF